MVNCRGILPVVEANFRRNTRLSGENLTKNSGKRPDKALPFGYQYRFSKISPSEVVAIWLPE